MKIVLSLFLAMALITVCCAALAEEEKAFDPDTLFADLAAAQNAYHQIEKDELAMNDELLATISKVWKETYLVPDYRILINGVAGVLRKTRLRRTGFRAGGRGDGRRTESPV